MKCTTKILIGVLLSGLVGIVVFSFWVYWGSEPSQRLQFGDKVTQMNVAPYRVVNVLSEEGEGMKSRHMAVVGNLNILPAADGQCTLSYQEEMKRYLSVVTKGDTLSLIFKISESDLSEQLKKQDWIDLLASQMELTADSSLESVHSQTRQSINVKHLKADSIVLSADYLYVDSCEIHSLSVNEAFRLELKNSHIDNVYLDLDGVRGWSVANCCLGNEYLTGSSVSHYNELQKGECRHMYWKPKNKDAQLRVTLNEGASVSLLN